MTSMSMTSPIPLQKSNDNLKLIMSSLNNAQYRKCQLETGISKPSILIGLRSIFPIPFCFSSDIMHLCVINIPDLFFLLWQGLIECEKTDNICNWDWAVLTGKN